MDKKTGVILSFIAGAAIGAAVAYLLTSGKGEEWLSGLKEELDKTKEDFNKGFADASGSSDTANTASESTP